MEQFAARREGAPEHTALKQRADRRWLWSVASAAVFLVGAVLVWDETRKPAVVASYAIAETQTEAQSETQADPQEEGFIEVPYAPPLAQGELVRVIHTELQPAALASMGVNVDPSWTTELPADLLLGQDGFPRAVRVSDERPAGGGS